MKTTLKLSYKVYQNERLKTVMFHGQQTAPLYIQVIYNKTPAYFKSSFFDQLSGPKYAIQSVLGSYTPVLNEIFKLEQQLLEILSQKHSKSFDLTIFKQDYYMLSHDLLFVLESGFQDFLITFFQDEGLPVLGFLIAEGGKRNTGESILKDLSASLDQKLFQKLTANAVHYAPPYIPLCAFLRINQKQQLPVLSVLQWTSEKTRSDFKAFLTQEYPEYHFEQIDEFLNKLIDSFRQ